MDDEGYEFMIVSYKMKGEPNKVNMIVKDTISSQDTVMVLDYDTKEEKVNIVRSIDTILVAEKEVIDYVWDDEWKNDYLEKIKPLSEKAKANGQDFSIILGGADIGMASDFAKETGIKANYYTADDILIKTIVRSNPGTVLWKDGVILDKWHINKLPAYEEIKAAHIK